MVLLRRVRELYCALRFDNTIKNAPNKHQCHQQSTKALNRGHFDFKLGLWGLSTILRRIKQASSRPVWHFSCNNLIPCLHWFLPKSLLWNLQYSGMFSVTVESHCQGKQNQKFPWQCDSTVTENISEYCKFHSSDLGKNQCKQGIKFLQLKCHTGLELAHLMRRSIVDSPHRPNLKSKWPRLRAFVDWPPRSLILKKKINNNNNEKTTIKVPTRWN